MYWCVCETTGLTCPQHMPPLASPLPFQRVHLRQLLGLVRLQPADACTPPLPAGQESEDSLVWDPGRVKAPEMGARSGREGGVGGLPSGSSCRSLPTPAAPRGRRGPGHGGWGLGGRLLPRARLEGEGPGAWLRAPAPWTAFFPFGSLWGTSSPSSLRPLPLLRLASVGALPKPRGLRPQPAAPGQKGIGAGELSSAAAQPFRFLLEPRGSESRLPS